MRILVYGDSNSWGTLADGSNMRHPRRWPRVMAEALGDGYEVVEDCLPGRTTAHDDPEMGGATFNGLAHLEASLLAQAPLDLVLIMLGTNDMKARFEPTAERISGNIARLAEHVSASLAGPGVWREGASPQVGIIVPPPLPENANDPDWDRVDEWAGGRDASLALAQAVDMRCADIPRLDAAPFAHGSHRDPIHFEPEIHEHLGAAVADWVRRAFSEQPA